MTIATTAPAVAQKRQSAVSRHLTAYLVISPWILGFVFFTLGPLLFSLTMSFYDRPVVGERTFVGIDNYRTMLFDDPQFWESLWITVKFAGIYVPFNIIMSFLIALMLHHATFASGFFRTAFYLPSVISGVALVTIWSWIYSREYVSSTSCCRSSAWTGRTGSANLALPSSPSSSPASGGSAAPC